MNFEKEKKHIDCKCSFKHRMQRQEINQDAPARNILRRRGSPLDEEKQTPQRRHRNNREDPQDFEIRCQKDRCLR